MGDTYKKGGKVKKYEGGGGVQSYNSAKKEVTPEGKREQTKKMRPPTADESSALELNRRQYKLGKEWAETDPKNDKTVVDYVRRESGAPKLQSLNTYKQIPEEVRDYEAYKDAGYKKGGKVSSASRRADGCAIRGKTRL
jgi:hypothetical protein